VLNLLPGRRPARDRVCAADDPVQRFHQSSAVRFAEALGKRRS
jgi:hypothetical protein